MNSETIYNQVQVHYGSVARAKNHSNSGAIAQAFGYTAEELQGIPHDANLGLSCGNPLAIASLRAGETVIDLGCGAGLDVFLAAKKVGPEGNVIGVDMNEDMLIRARENHINSGGPENVAFVSAKITAIPIEDDTADCIISNCVVNLIPEAEKPAVFEEMARLLKPGGRAAISDTLARKPFPRKLRESVAAYVGCVAGCSLKADYERFLSKAGFCDIFIVDTQTDFNVYADMMDEGNGEPSDAKACCIPPVVGTASGTAQETPCCVEGNVSNCCLKTSSETVNSKRVDSASTQAVTETCCRPRSVSNTQRSVAESWDLADIDINEWTGSYKIFAIKK